jgi:hypothetical protein
MVPGVRGELISGTYLSHACAGHEWRGPQFDAWVRELIRWWRLARRVLGPASGHRAIVDMAARPLLAHLGFSIANLEPESWGHAGVVTGGIHPRAALLCIGWGRPIDAAWREATRLGLTTSLPWALVYNGAAIAIVDCCQPWSRRYIAFDLEAACTDPEAATALCLLARSDALDDRLGECRLARMIAASDRHGVEVCGLLGAGVLEALGALVAGLDEADGRRRRFASRQRDTAILDQALTVVYRLLFLLFAEARGLVPTWHDVYHEAYGMEALCERLLTPISTRGTWASLQAMSRLAHAGCRTTDLEVTAFNGRLFAPARTPLAERRHLSEAAARQAVLALGTTPTPQGRARIRFHDLGVEQLGSVYERVLEMEPVRLERTLTLQPTSTDRKTSGSFYTPRAVTEFVVRRTLGPLVEGRGSKAILQLRVLDPAMGSGAFLAAACRYLAGRAEEALVAEGAWPEFDISDSGRADLRRTIAERCLYGVDLNPTAVQLTRLSLWLTTLAANRPLTFLDHHLVAGNSLIGARLIDVPRLPVSTPERRGLGARAPGDDRQLSLFDESDADGLRRAVLPERLRLALDPSDTARAVREKERRLDRLHAPGGPLARWCRAADLWCGLQLDPQTGISPGVYAELLRHVAGLDTSARPHHLHSLVDRAVAGARRERALHWELTFPEVFADDGGRPAADTGFDAVIGNPPWEMLRADTGGADARRDAREKSQGFVRYTRRSGHYALQGAGHVNQYQLFLERCLQLLRPGGRLGLILPSGIESDVGSVDLRRALLDTCRVDTWLDFENRHAIFPVHRGIRFVIVSAAREGVTENLPMIGGLTNASDLSWLPDHPYSPHAEHSPVLLRRRLIERIDPLHLTMPHVASATDLAVLTRTMEAPSLASDVGWGVRFGRELNATDDKRFFTDRRSIRARRSNAKDVLPIIEGKHLRPFGVDLDRATIGIDPEVAARLIDPAISFGRARVAYRDVASATNRVTLIAAVLPAGTLSTHTVFCSKARLDAADGWCLTALLNSLTANYLVRLQMSTHVTSALMARLPVPRPARGSSAHRTLAALAEELSASSIDDCADAYARVNTLAATLYGLSAAEYRHVVDTFPLLGEALRARCLEDYTRNHKGVESKGRG